MLTKKMCEIPMAVLGLGCMRLPKIDYLKDDIDYDKAYAMVDYAYQNGIRYFDTAYIYHGGDSEIFMGKALKKYPRDSFYLANKMPLWCCKNIDDVKRIFDEQLNKCQVEYFDFYLCHAMSLKRHHEFIKMGAYDYLIEQKKNGKIKKIGFSYHDDAINIIPLLDYLPWDFVQIQINYLDYHLQNAKFLYEEITNRSIDIVVMEPIRGGMLANLPAKASNVLRNFDKDMTQASWALRYVASFPNIKVILSGMSNMVQLQENIETFKEFKVLSNDEQLIIEQTAQILLGDDFVPCTGCRYCLPCPVEINIPKIFSIYNENRAENKKVKPSYQKLKPIDQLDQCLYCRVCESHCPQNIEIPDRLAIINEYIKKEV